MTGRLSHGVHRCSAKVDPRLPYPAAFQPCERPGTVEVDGKRYCWQHDPERAAKRERLSDLKITVQNLDRVLRLRKLGLADAVLDGAATRPLIDECRETEAELKKAKAELEALDK